MMQDLSRMASDLLIFYTQEFAYVSLAAEVNPAVIPRNHRIEEAISAATDGDYAPFETLLRVVARPFDLAPDDAAFARPPAPEEEVRATFCGT